MKTVGEKNKKDVKTWKHILTMVILFFNTGQSNAHLNNNSYKSSCTTIYNSVTDVMGCG